MSTKVPPIALPKQLPAKTVIRVTISSVANPSSTRIYLASKSESPWKDYLLLYSSVEIMVGGAQFLNLATTLAYFIGAVYGKVNPKNYKPASWLLLARANEQAEHRAKFAIGDSWFVGAPPAIADAVIFAAEQVTLSKLPTDA